MLSYDPFSVLPEAEHELSKVSAAACITVSDVLSMLTGINIYIAAHMAMRRPSL